MLLAFKTPVLWVYPPGMISTPRGFSPFRKLSIGGICPTYSETDVQVPDVERDSDRSGSSGNADQAFLPIAAECSGFSGFSAELTCGSRRLKRI